ncbi:hypothetical protein [Devosia sediminis]|uniref:Uncharacterized protein n=1 Tax=Devosia sediminis TaxID=2798801 RepID=A0A934MKY9_9HYPH|nr:hypothetical protein [Devosia sediminis]MBJ3784605.1 hypothetical protein [Devosia sediminis]
MRIRDIGIGLASYVVAVCVSAISVLVLFALSDAVTSQAGRMSGLPAIDGPLIWVAIYLVGAVGLVPFLLAIAVLHRIGKTGWLAHTVAGIVVSLVAQVLVWFGGLPSLSDLIASSPITLGGAVAGFTYWATKVLLGRFVRPSAGGAAPLRSDQPR